MRTRAFNTDQYLDSPLNVGKAKCSDVGRGKVWWRHLQKAVTIIPVEKESSQENEVKGGLKPEMPSM